MFRQTTFVSSKYAKLDHQRNVDIRKDSKYNTKHSGRNSNIPAELESTHRKDTR
jgi:hypothetical protein